MIFRLKTGVSATALLMCAASLAMGSVAVAQDTSSSDAAADDGTTEVVVVGVRRALQNAQTRKRNADTVVDSITATDIGAFPDKSVAEALQRVAGVSVTRFAAKNDVMRFSAEPSGIVIRGLLQVRSEFNGRDSFSADSSYGLSWSDVSPELMGGVDAYKNVTAEMIEGGIAGTVNLRTRLPFDQKGRLLSASFEANYGDLAREVTPTASFLWADRFSTSVGEFGFLANVTHSEITTNSQGTTIPRIMPFDAGTYTGEKVYIPSTFSINDNTYERTRDGVSLAAQWRSNDGNLQATLQYNRSKYQNEWYEDSVTSQFNWVDPAAYTHSDSWDNPNMIMPADVVGGFGDAYTAGTPFTFRDDGLFQTGVITQGNTWGYGDIDWSTSSSYLAGSTDRFGRHDAHGWDVPLIDPCIANSASFPGAAACQYGVGVDSQSRYANAQRVTEDVALNLVWTPTDRLKLNFDVQQVKATTTNYDVSLGMRFFANVGLDLTGKYPRVDLAAPSRMNNIGSDPFNDIRNYSPTWIMDHVTDSEGEMLAYRFDAQYSFDSPWLDSISGGVRFADREQTLRWSNYNWSPITGGIWLSNPDAYFADAGPVGTFAGYEPGYYESRDLGKGILNGELINQQAFQFIKHDVISSPEELAKRFSIAGQSGTGLTAVSGWDPICSRTTELPDSCFTGGEVLDVREKTDSAYVMLKFGGADAVIFDGITVSGNVGLRFVQTTLTSNGAINYPTEFTDAETNCEPMAPELIAGLPAGAFAVTPQCLAKASLEDQAFSDGEFLARSTETKHSYYLPSFNVKFGLTDEWVLRFAASRAMSKPDFGLLRNYIRLNRGQLQQSDIVAGNPNLVLDSSGQPVSYRYSYTGTTGNPALKAITADQFDLSIEYYFAQVGSFTASVFHKTFHDYIQVGSYETTITHNGVTRDVVIQGPVNGEGAKIAGIEVAYQRYFDFLPAPWDGFGIQANYTYIKNSGVKNTDLVLDSADGGTVAGSSRGGSFNPGRLEGLSDHQYNLVVMYEKEKFGARLAYNWRSEYLISVNDCCIGLPVWNQAEGFLDGSIRYQLSPSTELSIQGSNLLGTETVYRQQVAGATEANPDVAKKLMPAGWYENDRRITLGLRFKY